MFRSKPAAAARQPAEPRGQARALPRLLAAGLVSAVPIAVAIWVALPPERLAGLQTALATLRTQARALAGLTINAPAIATAPTPRPVVARPRPVPAEPRSGAILAYGDQLKITFYESFAVAVGAGTAGEPVATIYPRLDLSGTYVIDADGQLSVPRLGTFRAAGEPMGQLQVALERGSERAFGRSADVHVAILAREPVYVLGAVRNAGAFAWRPGMTVLQALGAAGWQPAAAVADRSAAIEAIRERQRLRQAEVGAARLLVTLARLSALSAGTDRLPLPEAALAELHELVAPDEAATMIAGARATLVMELASFSQEVALAERQIAVARAGVAAQHVRVEQLADLIDKKNLRLRELQGIAARGSLAHFKLTDLTADISEVVARREDARASEVQAERQLLEAQIILARVNEQHTTSLDKQISAVRQQRDDAKSSIASMHAVLQVLTPIAGADAGAGGPIALTITRRTPEGTSTLHADEATPLLPGDVVRIGRLEPADVAARPAAGQFSRTQY